MKKLLFVFAVAAGLLSAQVTHDYGGRLVEGGINNLGTIAGTNTYTVSPTPALVALAQNVSYCGYFTNGNTGAATLNINSLGATSIVKLASTALASGDIAATSSHCFIYNGTSFVIDHIDNAAGGSGTVTSVATGCGLTGGTITATGTLAQSLTVTVKTTSYTIVAGDMCNDLDMNSGTAQTFTLPQAGTTGFETGKFIRLRSIGAGATTTSTTTSTFVGGGYSASSLVLYQNQIVLLQSDGTNWNVLTGQAGTIASGTSALGTSAISANACASVVTTSATGVATTDVIAWVPNADISAVTGYGAASTDGLIIYPYPTANNVNFKVCNGTASSITPGAVTLNWRVAR